MEICTLQIQKPPRCSEGAATLGITQQPFSDPSHTEQYLRFHSAGTWKEAAFLKGCLKMVRKNVFLFSHEMHPFHGDYHNESSAHGEQSWSEGTSLWSFLFQESEDECIHEKLYWSCELWSYQGKKHSVCISATLQLPWVTPNLHTGNWRKKQNSLCGHFRVYEIYSTPALTLHPAKQHRANSAPSAPAFKTKSKFACLFKA